jgi:hypothetical protein
MFGHSVRHTVLKLSRVLGRALIAPLTSDVVLLNMVDSEVLVSHYPFRSHLATVCTAVFGVQNFYILPTQCVYVFCVVLRINNNYFSMQHELIGFMNKRDGMFLLRGTY